MHWIRAAIILIFYLVNYIDQFPVWNYDIKLKCWAHPIVSCPICHSALTSPWILQATNHIFRLATPHHSPTWSALKITFYKSKLFPTKKYHPPYGATFVEMTGHDQCGMKITQNTFQLSQKWQATYVLLWKSPTAWCNFCRINRTHITPPRTARISGQKS